MKRKTLSKKKSKQKKSMPVPLKDMRDLLLPGLKNVRSQITAQQYQHMQVGLGYAITRKAIDDNLFRNLLGSKEVERDCAYTLEQLHDAEDFINAG